MSIASRAILYISFEFKDGMLTKQTGSTYTIERVSTADERNYTCRVNTDEGSKSETYILYVGFLPRFEDSTPSPIMFDWKDGNQVLDCTAESRQPLTVIVCFLSLFLLST